MRNFLLCCLIFFGSVDGYFQLRQLKEQMTAEEWKRSGLDKLTTEEGDHLESWLTKILCQYHFSVPKLQDGDPWDIVFEAKKLQHVKYDYDPHLFDESKTRYQLSIMSLMQHEAPYIKEWIEYHKMLGVEHFYLYNNESNDTYMKVLAPYIAAGDVELIEWPYHDPRNPPKGYWMQMQFRTNEDALQRTRGVSRWVAFIDTDEFLVPLTRDNLIDFLADYEAYGGVIVNWVTYGTSWVKSIPKDRLMIEMLTLRATDDFRENGIFKSIVKPHRVEKWENPHWCVYRPPFYAVDSEHQQPEARSMFHHKRPLQRIRLHHYWFRDQEFFHNVKIPRWKKAAWRVRSSPEEIHKREQDSNALEDKTIYKYVPELRRRMGL